MPPTRDEKNRQPSCDDEPESGNETLHPRNLAQRCRSPNPGNSILRDVNFAVDLRTLVMKRGIWSRPCAAIRSGFGTGTHRVVIGNEVLRLEVLSKTSIKSLHPGGNSTLRFL